MDHHKVRDALRTGPPLTVLRDGSRVVFIALVFLGVILATSHAALAQARLRQVHQDFDADPGWESVNNRVVATDVPTITQGFGYRSGAIGGTVWSSTTPACYEMPLGPFSFDEPLSASGRIRIRRAPSRSGVYVGFYRSTRQGWRPWSAMMIQLTGSQRGEGLSHQRDDLTYTSRARQGVAPAARKPRVIEVPYPEGGRKY